MVECKTNQKQNHFHQTRCPYYRERGCFAFNPKKFGTFDAEANGKETCLKSFQKIKEMLNDRNTNHATENSWNSGKIKWCEISPLEIFKILSIRHEVALFSVILKNAVTFATGISRLSNRKFWSNRKAQETKRTLVSLGTREQSSRKGRIVYKVNS